MPPNISAPMPEYGTPFLNPDGRTISEVWFNLIWTLVRRGGGESGIDLAALVARVDDIDAAVAANAPSLTLILALIGRVVELERADLGFVPLPARGTDADVPPVSAPARHIDVVPDARMPMVRTASVDGPASRPATVRASGGQLKVTGTLSGGSGANTATLSNSPAAGNPTKWIPINDNGTVRYVPAW
ncbi:hypothetical protein DX980_20205 [Burkholderia gladioli]|uniref:hypothetical protein n=1 Tax=Burkholderia gladioli TaxID=28095 RepID=UPI0013648E7D|nr:hypothetical protein [Burkholderia gladioli]KAF1065279.1 hypothetical protein LvStA_03954 [Burkholderia gladioli]WAG21368.1 hypothetical protein DX980_20205 [Burkholderia gladioli]